MSFDVAWTQIVPTWYETNSTAAVGNGMLGLRYRRTDSGTIELNFMLQIGSTTNLGSAGWGFSLPFLLPPTAFSGSSPFYSEWTLPARCWDTSASRMWTGCARITSIVPPGAVSIQSFPPTAYFMDFFVGTNADRVGSAAPFAWASGDILSASGSVEAFGN